MMSRRTAERGGAAPSACVSQATTTSSRRRPASASPAVRRRRRVSRESDAGRPRGVLGSPPRRVAGGRRACLLARVVLDVIRSRLAAGPRGCHGRALVRAAQRARLSPLEGDGRCRKNRSQAERKRCSKAWPSSPGSGARRRQAACAALTSSASARLRASASARPPMVVVARASLSRRASSAPESVAAGASPALTSASTRAQSFSRRARPASGSRSVPRKASGHALTARSRAAESRARSFSSSAAGSAGPWRALAISRWASSARVPGGAEPLPARVRLAARGGPDLLPARLLRLELLAGLEPVRGVGQGLGPRGQLLLEAQVLRLARGLGREVGVDLLLEGRPRRLVALAQGLRLAARRRPHFRPAVVETPEIPGHLLEVLARAKALQAATQLLLDGRVAPAAPLLGLARFLRAGEQRGARLLEPAGQLGRQRGHVVVREAGLAQRDIGVAEDEGVRFRDGAQPRAQRLRLRELLPAIGTKARACGSGGWRRCRLRRLAALVVPFVGRRLGGGLLVGHRGGLGACLRRRRRCRLLRRDALGSCRADAVGRRRLLHRRVCLHGY